MPLSARGVNTPTAAGIVWKASSRPYPVLAKMMGFAKATVHGYAVRSGPLCAGHPETAIRYAWMDASCDHKGDGIYAEMFIAAMEAAAFYCSDIRELLDESGEFDLTGSAFAALIRYKLDKTFENVPALDGLVLTLTEADYSAIHNSDTEKYPPEKVVSFIINIFASELEKRGKRFIIYE